MMKKKHVQAQLSVFENKIQLFLNSQKNSIHLSVLVQLPNPDEIPPSPPLLRFPISSPASFLENSGAFTFHHSSAVFLLVVWQKMAVGLSSAWLEINYFCRDSDKYISYIFPWIYW